MSFKDENEFKNTMVNLQIKFEKRFDKPPVGVTPKKEHFFAFYNFYQDCIDSDNVNVQEQLVCKNQQNNIKNITRKIYNMVEDDFNNEYENWCKDKTFPSWS